MLKAGIPVSGQTQCGARNSSLCMFPYYFKYSVVATTNRICVVGNMHGSAMHTIDYSSKQGQIGIGGRFFSIKQCIDHLVSQHGYDRERAQRMCFAVGLTLFPAEKALRCCGVGQSTPGHESCDSKYHSFPKNFAAEMRRIGGNKGPGDFRQPALS